MLWKAIDKQSACISGTQRWMKQRNMPTAGSTTYMAPQRLKQITVVTDFVAMQWYMVSLSWCVPQLCISVWCLPVSHVSLVSGQVHDNRIAAIVLP